MEGCESRAVGGCRLLEGAAKGSVEQADGLEGERGGLADLCVQWDRVGSKNVTGKLRSGRIGEPIVG